MNYCKMSVAAVIALLGLAAGPAYAEVTLGFQQVDNSSGGAPLSNFVTTDLVLTTHQADWTGSNLLIQLTSGSIYQDGFGNNNSPNPAWFGMVPSLQFDTYVATPGGYSSPASSAGAADLGSGPQGTVKFDTAGINYNWFDVVNTGACEFTTGRFSISNNAAGTWQFFGVQGNGAGAGNQVIASGVITNGGFSPVPEPGTIAMLVAGLLSLLAYVWRKRRN